MVCGVGAPHRTAHPPRRLNPPPHPPQLTMAALLGLHCVVRDATVLRGLPHATWHGWSGEALRGWPAYLR